MNELLRKNVITLKILRQCRDTLQRVRVILRTADAVYRVPTMPLFSTCPK
jgi:hypothetical protein